MSKAIQPSHYEVFSTIVNALLKGGLEQYEMIMAGNLAEVIKNAAVGGAEYKQALSKAIAESDDDLTPEKYAALGNTVRLALFEQKVMEAESIREYASILAEDLIITSDGVKVVKTAAQGVTTNATTIYNGRAAPAAVDNSPAKRLDDTIGGFTWTDDQNAQYRVMSRGPWAYVYDVTTKESWYTKDGKTATHAVGFAEGPGLAACGGQVNIDLRVLRRFSTTMPTFQEVAVSQ